MSDEWFNINLFVIPVGLRLLYIITAYMMCYWKNVFLRALDMVHCSSNCPENDTAVQEI